MKRKLISEIKAQAVLAKLFADEELARQKAAMDSLNKLLSSAMLGSATADYKPRSMLSREDHVRYSLVDDTVIELDDAISDLSDAASVRRALDLVDRHREKTFVEKVLEYSIKKDMSSKAIYKAAQIDRKLFSKIMCDNEYRPARDTCMALAYALKLDYGEASDLISRAGYTFSESSRRDILLEYFFRKQKYDLDLINGVLYELNEKTLGSGRF